VPITYQKPGGNTSGLLFGGKVGGTSKGGGAASVQRAQAPDKGVISSCLPGLLLCAAVALPSFELSRYNPSLDALALSLILGMVLRNVLGPGTAVTPGVRLASAVFIPAGIILYGTRLDFLVFTGLPGYSIIVVIAAFTMFFIAILSLSHLMDVNRSTGLLIACGSAICGASAIAVLSPVVRARERDMSMALIVTTVAGLTGAMIYPILGDWFSLPEKVYGILCGSTLQQTGIVRLAASHMGTEALEFAIPVKMLRIAMLAPTAVALATSASLQRNAGPGDDRSARALQALKRAWFIPIFVAVALVFSFAGGAVEIRESFKPFATIALSMALASIGLRVDLGSIRAMGSRPLLLGFAGWALVGSVILAALVILAGALN
jgi:uncharacterized integral membrane protein (TIGR00698 family)